MAKSDQLLSNLQKLHPKLIDLSLGRVEALLAKMHNPHHKLPAVIHIAGTNGKGSTSAFLRAILEAAGKRVHAYTSPHLVKFHERIVLAGDDGVGRPISEEALCDVLQRAEAANDKDDITQFEITTAAALLAFSEAPADVLLLEVGLGGRLDATNVIPRPALSVITPVSFDHSEKLGNTLAKIAAEKAGILKPGVMGVISQQENSALCVIRTIAERVGAPLKVWGEDFDGYEQNGRLIVQADDRLLDLPMPGLVGRHQIINAATAVAGILQLNEFNLEERAIETGVRGVRWPGRLQRLGDGVLTDGLRAGTELWLDGGHNPAAGKALAQTLADLDERSSKPIHLIVGMLSAKDTSGFLAPFRGLVGKVFAVPVRDALQSAQTPQQLAATAESVGFTAHAATNLIDAVRQADSMLAGAKRILICGSLYLAGEALSLHEGAVPQTG